MTVVLPSVKSLIHTGIGEEQAGGFNPGIISGLSLWLDASRESSITLNAGNVSQWNDLSGNGNHAVQAGAGLQPLYVPPTQIVPGTVTFTNDSLTIADSPTMRVGTEFSIFLVFDKSAIGGGFSIPFNGGESGGEGPLFLQSSANWTMRTSITLLLDGTGFAADASITSISKTSGQIPVFKMKGQSSVNMTFNTTDTGSSNAAWLVGSNVPASGAFWDGDISEILMYNRQLTSVEFDLVHNSLGVKYGLSETTVNIV